jgi:glycosyltransferase involved in cell wall biosynthesis
MGWREDREEPSLRTLTRSSFWHLMTGEYPPRPGGVSDHSFQVAEGLAKTGLSVHVWSSDFGEPTTPNGVVVHRLNDPWSGAGLAEIDRGLEAFSPPRRLLVQYTPNAWGRKGLNFGFVRWLNSRKTRGDDVRPIVHEPWYRPEPWDRPWRYVLPPLQRRMAYGLLTASSTVYVTIPHWETLLSPYTKQMRFLGLPVPSNVPFVDDPVAVAEIRRRVAGDSPLVIGTFGTYREEIAPRLRDILPRVLNRADRIGLLLGRNGAAVARSLSSGASRVVATGGLPPREVSLHLQACDVLIQPYRDGVTTRRGTVMAGLCQGKALVTTFGKMTEPIWKESGCIALAADGDTSDLVSKEENLLANPGLRQKLGEAARLVYVREFALERTIETLLRD